MIKQIKIFFVLALTAFVFSCAKKSTNQNVQNNCTISKAGSTPVNYTILAGSGQFFPISIIGGYTYISGYGVKGILVYRLSQSQFMAYERSCTKDGCDNAKALVWVQTGNTACKDSICGSNFSIMDGSIQNGPATIPLYQYHTTWDGNQLHIYN
jgi:Rieske Fe-S protein